MPVPASIVKGTPFEERVKGPGVEDRVAIMDKMGIDVQAISVNDFWWWDIKDQGLARAVCQHHNETLAKAARDYPGRLYGMASVPLQFPELAVEMLQAAVKNGARGVTVGGHVKNESLSAPRFDPFWAKVAEMGELVFMHPNGSANIIKEGGARRARRPRQHRRQPARDDGVPVAADLRRDVRQVPDAEGRAARTAAGSCRRTWDAPKWRASGRDRTASSRRSRATT